MAELLELSDKARLELSLSTRENIIKELMDHGISKLDRSDKELLVSALDGLDRTILSKAKLKSDDQTSQTNRDITRLMADVLSRVAIKPLAMRTVAPSLDNDIKLEDIVDGEMDIQPSELKYDEFMK
jgi:hypothetical protein